MTNGHKSLDSATRYHFVDATAWKNYDPRDVAIVYHLYCGGIQDAAELSKFTRKPVREAAIEGMIDVMDRLIYGPLSPGKPVVCNTCGSELVDIPCVRCRIMKHEPTYRVGPEH